MRLRITKVDSYQFYTCVQHGLWGSKTSRFKNWQKGDHLLFIVNKMLTGLATVCGEPFQSRTRVWDNGLFPHRIPISFVQILADSNRIPVLGRVRDILTGEWGPNYGWGILNQQLLDGDPGSDLVEIIRKQANNVKQIITSLDDLLEESRIEREKTREQRPHKIAQRRVSVQPRKDSTEIATKGSTSHTRAQAILISLGKAVGCSVWIASNDRHRKHKGKTLGEDCLGKLPSFGLNKEATTRIGLIDTIWVRQGAPVCAFEVESTTSVYSGLLRMSDLLAVIPAINIKLFIVAPLERRDKVMRELGRPTFQKIGLNEYCRFISQESLVDLEKRVSGLGGHVHETIIDTIAEELE